MRRKLWRLIKGRACRILLKQHGAGDIRTVFNAIPSKCRESSAIVCGVRACTVESFEFTLACGRIALVACSRISRIDLLPPVPYVLKSDQEV